MRHTNALIDEKSPYLLQHAHNPVDWLPWGDDAFERAAREDKPVLVSIGYSTCHWCHVMERESFEDEAIASLLNEAFICIKVDREERPDVDGVYMNICQMLTGAGGWPLNVLVTPDKKPFFAATYIPPTSRGGRPGLTDLIPRVRQIWQNEREKIIESSESITQALQEHESAAASTETVDHERLVRLVLGSLSQSYDQTYGGFGNAPKFPSAHTLLFLLRHAAATGNEAAHSMAVQTLSAMRKGGIWDHVGYGFHRYSTDNRWLLPHFEKMLYDQAMLTMAYLEAYQLTGNTEFSHTAEDIITYVMRDLHDENGAFYTAEDADSEGEEGLFHTWTTEEINTALSPELSEAFIQHYGIVPEGNFQDEATRQVTGRNIPNELTADGPADANAEAARQTLFAIREKRPRPHLDDKILTDMNGLMIAALARAGRVLGRNEFTTAATKAASFILTRLRDKDGNLLHGYRNGPMRSPATLDDHAFLLWGLLELHATTRNDTWLAHAAPLANTLVAQYEDKQNGGFHLMPETAAPILVRQKEAYDGAIPSGNSVTMHVLPRLAVLLDDDSLLQAAKHSREAHSAILNKQPMALVHMVGALPFLDNPTSVTVAGPRDAPESLALLAQYDKGYYPDTVMRLIATDNNDETGNTSSQAYAEQLKRQQVTAAAWICRNEQCEPPVVTPEELSALL